MPGSHVPGICMCVLLWLKAPRLQEDLFQLICLMGGRQRERSFVHLPIVQAGQL
jgi:hypothetical protein